MVQGDYIVLKSEPEYPANEFPSRKDCEGFEYMTMDQMCNITDKKGLGRHRIHEAFGGDKGRNLVLSVRKARTYKNHKYVLVSAVIDYLAEQGINW